jgi:hypothetical protein
MENVIAIRRDKVLVQKKVPTFQVAVKHIQNPHKFQFFFNYGKSAMGPWLCVGINESIYGFGYLPRTRKR